MARGFLFFIGLLFAAFTLQSQENAGISIEDGAEEDGAELLTVNPAELGIDAQALDLGIRAIILEALDSAAFPGCQILLAKGGKIFYEKSFGFHTYDSILSVKNTDIYDLASVTKTTAATLSLMKLYDLGLFDPDQTFGHYFPKIARGRKKKLSMREVLAHQAGLKSWIRYYAESQRRNGKYRRNTVAGDSSARFPYRISESGLFLHKDFKKRRIYRMIKKSRVSRDKHYLYSGLSFYLFPEFVERTTGKTFDQFLNDEFYEPLGAATLCFNAGERFELDRIVPTEVDTFFRMQTLHGVVHDEGAAMMLGVSGNAGLFSDARDLAKVYQMLLNDGSYAGKQYLKPGTVREFTRCQFCETGNKRGLGFDKPLIEYDSVRSSVARAASPESFGHGGYTGTFVWADPANDLLFIFLSNRVYPTRNNRKIYTLNIRPRIHSLVYNLLAQSRKGAKSGG